MVPAIDNGPAPGPAGSESAQDDTLAGLLEPSGKVYSARTTATYDEIARIYYDKWHDRSPIRQHLARFVDMMSVYGLAEMPVLDVGCGPGFDADFFRRAGLYAIGVDLSTEMMRRGRAEFGGDYIQADMRRLPLANKIGGVWMSASLLHVPRAETPAVMKCIAEMLAPGGILYVSLKAGRGEEWTAESHGQPLPRYFVYWQPDELDALLGQAGLQIVDGWTSQGDQPTTWLIRFARKTNGDLDLPLFGS